MRYSGALILFLVGLVPLQGQAQGAPLSAIDWLRPPTVDMPVIRATPQPTAPQPAEPPVASTIGRPQVTVTTLGQPRLDAVGLLPSQVTGLPQSLWQASPAARLVQLIAERKVDRLPAMQALLFTLLMAEANAPFDAGPDAPLLQARIDALMRLGAVDAAQALLERAGAGTPRLFKRWFDATLLTGDEDRACAALRAAPHLSPSYAARIYCLARGGDWPGAALTFDTARVLGFLGGTEEALVAHFLDPELYEGEVLPLPPVRPSPLLFRLYEAAGEPLPTATLPLAFAMSDLRATAGWKAELAAAERLARTGALPFNRLLGIYTERLPAASGGIWDRVEAIQRFDTAMRAGDPGAVARYLPKAWAAMRAARLEVPFAEGYGAELMRLPLPEKAAALAYDIALVSPDYETAAQAYGARYPKRQFETSLARGLPQTPQADPLRVAITLGFSSATPPADLAALLAQNQLGETILRAMALYEQAAEGDLNALAPALSTLRALGLEDTARRAALQLALLRYRG